MTDPADDLITFRATSREMQACVALLTRLFNVISANKTKMQPVPPEQAQLAYSLLARFKEAAEGPKIILPDGFAG